jgi:2-oxoisovalerate dehydrogenase E2 component (dihydrolipoyl transacylase)
MTGAPTNIRVFNLPDVGEGLVEARVVEILVEEGQVVSRFAPILEVETDKSIVELTAPWAGTVHKIHAVIDEYIDVGKPVLEIELSASAEEDG